MLSRMIERGKLYWKAIQMEIREHKRTFIVYTVLRILVILMLIWSILQGDWENVFLCVLTLLLFIVPSLIQVEFKIELPVTLEIILLCFIFAAEILGEIQKFYLRFPYWDTVLHTLNGFLAAGIGFSMVNLLNRSEKLEFQLSPVFVCVVAFCFSMTVGVLWEFVEFGADQYLGKDMQKDTWIHEITSVELNPEGKNVPVTISDIESVSINDGELVLDGYLDIGLMDTMEDLFVNFVGATVFCVIGYIWLVYDRKNERSWVSQFVPKVRDKDKDYKNIVFSAQQKG